MAARWLGLIFVSMLSAAALLPACSESSSSSAEPPLPSTEESSAAPGGDASDRREQPRRRDAPTPRESAPVELDPDVTWITESAATVMMGGETFTLEIADSEGERFRGLSFRDEIPADGGMVFVFTDKAVRDFVMRDCRVTIDIAYTTDDGRVVQLHAMGIEPRMPGESNLQYDNRLTRYSSKFPVSFAFEFAGGTLERLGVREGDRVVTDFNALLERAQ